MAEVLSSRLAPLAPSAPADERSARRTLREQVARLETELSELFCSSWPRGPQQLRTEWSVGGRGGPRLLSLAELEELRDDLAARVSDARRALSDRTWVEEQNRRMIEEMLLEPEAHHWAHVSSEDIGEAGCRHWHVRPRWGILGMFLNWWRVVISSGCPLPAAMGRRSRKRGGETTRAERDAARRERTLEDPTPRPRPRPGRPSRGERPRAPWGSFPLSELVILLGIVLIAWGGLSGEDGAELLFAGLVIASLGGGELALREHLAGYRSHSTLLAGVAAFVVVTVVALGLGPVKVWLLLLIGAAVFAAAFYAMRAVFKGRSGGVGFR